MSLGAHLLGAAKTLEDDQSCSGEVGTSARFQTILIVTRRNLDVEYVRTEIDVGSTVRRPITWAKQTQLKIIPFGFGQPRRRVSSYCCVGSTVSDNDRSSLL